METDHHTTHSTENLSNRKKNTASVPTGLTAKLRHLINTSISDYKINSAYIDLISPETLGNVKFTNTPHTSPITNLRTMIKESIIKEFGPDIKNTSKFEHLIDTVMNKIMAESINDLEDLT